MNGSLKVAITNAVLSNTGDAAIYEAILESLRSAGICDPADVIVFDANARVTRRLYPQWTVYQQLTVSPPREPARLRSVLQRLRLKLVDRLQEPTGLFARSLRRSPFSHTAFAKSYRALTSCDLVISSGGTYLVDHYDFAPRVTELTLAHQSGSVVVLWTQSLGPFTRPQARQWITQISAVIDAVYFRDERSRMSWQQATRMPEQNAVVPDVVFALPRAAPVLRLAEKSAAAPRALISVREWSRGVDSDLTSTVDYDQMLRAGAAELIAEGWHVEALSTCQGVPSYAYDDSKVARRIFGGMNVSINSQFHTPRALLGELAGADLVVTTRMHLAILSLLAQRPVIAIAYEFKTVELFESLGLGDFVVRIEDARPEWLHDRITRLVSQPDLAVLSDEQLAQVSELALEPARELAETLPRLRKHSVSRP